MVRPLEDFHLELSCFKHTELVVIQSDVGSKQFTPPIWDWDPANVPDVPYYVRFFTIATLLKCIQLHVH